MKKSVEGWMFFMQLVTYLSWGQTDEVNTVLVSYSGRIFHAAGKNKRGLLPSTYTSAAKDRLRCR